MSVPQHRRRASEAHLSEVWPDLLFAENSVGFEQLDVLGMNAVLTISTLPENLWTQGVVYPWPAAAAVCKLVSASTDDDVGQSGATAVLIEGLDTNGAASSETLALDGTTPVNTSNSYLRVNRVTVTTCGSGGANAGVITLSHDTSGPIISSIMAGHGVSMDGVWTVDSGHTWAISRFTADIITPGASGSEVALGVYVRASATAPWIRRATLPLLAAGTSDAELTFPDGLLLAAGSDFKVEIASCDANDMRLVARAHGLLIDDDLL